MVFTKFLFHLFVLTLVCSLATCDDDWLTIYAKHPYFSTLPAGRQTVAVNRQIREIFANHRRATDAEVLRVFARLDRIIRTAVDRFNRLNDEDVRILVNQVRQAASEQPRSRAVATLANITVPRAMVALLDAVYGTERAIQRVNRRAQRAVAQIILRTEHDVDAAIPLRGRIEWPHLRLIIANGLQQMVQRFVEGGSEITALLASGQRTVDENVNLVKAEVVRLLPVHWSKRIVDDIRREDAELDEVLAQAKQAVPREMLGSKAELLKVPLQIEREVAAITK